ncbi:ankyrin repeat domain-containing protein [Endozoicomonas elysicola]|nr:ankyrin repeat domain-containing protein [Endozoicomonas elysicola]
MTEPIHQTGQAGAPKKLSEYNKKILPSGSREEWENESKELLYACRYGMAKVVNELLNRGVKPNLFANQRSPLDEATSSNHEEIALTLLASGVALDLKSEEKSKNGSEALHYACRYGMAKVVNELLNRGVNPNLLAYQRSPLDEATSSNHEKIALTLLVSGLKLDLKSEEKSKNGSEALHHACRHGMAKVVNELLNRGVNPNLFAYQRSPLDEATSSNHEEIALTLLVSSLELDLKSEEKSKNGSEALHYACRHGMVKVVNELLNRGVNPNLFAYQRSPLDEATSSNHEEIALTLLASGVELDLKSEEKSKNGSEALHHACRHEMVRVVDELLLIGVHPGSEKLSISLHNLQISNLPASANARSLQNLRPLKLICASTVRKNLMDNREKTKQGLQLSIDELPLPKTLKRYVHTYDSPNLVSPFTS